MASSSRAKPSKRPVFCSVQEVAHPQASPTSDDLEVDLQPIKHKDAHLFDPLHNTDTYQLSNIITHETKAMPRGEWVIEFDEQGNGVCVSVAQPGDEQQVFDLADFKTTMFIYSESDEVLLHKPYVSPQSPPIIAMQVDKCSVQHQARHIISKVHCELFCLPLG